MWTLPIVSGARLSHGEERIWSDSHYILWLTCQEFLGMFIGLVTNGGRYLVVFLGILFRERGRFNGVLPFQNMCQLCSHLATSLSVLLLSMQHKSLTRIWPESLFLAWESGLWNYLLGLLCSKWMCSLKGRFCGLMTCFTERLLLHACLLSCVYSVLVARDNDIQKTIDTRTLLVNAINFGGLSISSSNQWPWDQSSTINCQLFIFLYFTTYHLLKTIVFLERFW